DLDVSPDGKKLLFSLRLPLIKGAKEINQPTWKIYQYDAVLKTITQLTNDSTQRGHDVGAHYLPDGRIVFASTRQTGTQGILIDEGRPEYPAQTDGNGPKQDIFLLHVMNADGSNIHQISFNTNHDFAPSVLSNGQIVFSRYESINDDQISLYRVNPDGTGLELFYGANSHATGANNAGTNDSVIQFLSARQRADGKLLALVRPLQYAAQGGLDTQGGGDIVEIDAGDFVEIHQQAIPSAMGTPATGGTGQASATTLGVTTDPDMASLGGRFASVFPLFDGTNRMLVSWAPCLVLASAASSTTSVCNNSNTTGAAVTLAPPEYTIWVYDFAAGTLSPILAAESGLMILEPVLLQARVPAPTAALVTPPTSASTTLAGLGLGVLDIRSVYDFDGVDTVAAQTGNAVQNIAALADPKQATADQRPARFIRVEKAVEIPSMDVRKINGSAFGPAGMGMREILAYAPIEPDGSVKIELPANVPFTIEILDKNARRLAGFPRHTSWLQLLPGETRVCTGCHNPANPANPLFPLSHGRSGLTNSVYAGAAGPGVPFPNTMATFLASNKGDTMAETRVATTCQTGAAMTCSQIPGIDVLYTDVWTDPAVAGRPADTSFSYLYSDLSTPKPANTHCVTWDALCRSTIHYPDDTTPPYHIQSLWDFPRLSTVGGIAVDHTCVSCHTPVGANAVVQIPAGNLDLRAAASSADPSVSTSYRQLLFPRNQQQLIMGVPTNTGVVLPPPIAAGSAVNSRANFLDWFDGTNHGQTVDHTGFLTTAELRLITEWIDIGAQYYNDPFVAPVAN
ncbi:MAG TPA: hypothetical protein VKP66_06755, partial [Steroidobacteraceae bacterium]|nr:hypothetical protein [Steroidobacteraceae bacterium]